MDAKEFLKGKTIQVVINSVQVELEPTPDMEKLLKEYHKEQTKTPSEELADFLEFVDKMIPKIVFLKMTNKEVAEMYLKNKSLSVKEEEK